MVSCSGTAYVTSVREDIKMWDAIRNLDGNILLWIQEYLRNDLLTPVMKALTHLGDAGWIWILCTIVFLLWKKRRAAGICMTFSLLGSLLLNNLLLKNLVARIRPYETVEGLSRIIEAQADLSFPSGHAGSSFAAAVAIYLSCPRRIGIPALVLAALISLSRLYVGVHYPTDVICGALIGTAVAIVICRTYQRRLKRTA